MITKETLEEIYEQHIRPLSPSERLQLLALMAEDLANEAPDTLDAIEGRDRDVMEFHGVGANDPIGMDAQEYVNQLREERDPGP